MKLLNSRLLFQLGLYYIAATFPLSFQLSNLGIIFLVLGWILKAFEHKALPKLQLEGINNKAIFLTFTLLFLWQLASLSYATDTAYGLKSLEGKLSLLAFPILLNSHQYRFVVLIKGFKVFLYSMLSCTLVLLLRSFLHYTETGSLYIYHDFVGLLDFHAVFYSYYTFLALLIMLYLRHSKAYSFIERKLFIPFVLLLFIGLIFAASKNVLVVSLIIFIVYFLRKLLSGKLQLKPLLIGLLVLITGAFLGSRIPTVEKRMAELTSLRGLEAIEKVKQEEVLTHQDRVELNGTSVRLLFWYIGFEQLSEQNRWLLGLNPADRRQVINKRFYEVGLNPWFENYNLHNQFIQTLVELGLIGLAIYLALHFFYFRLAFQKQDFFLLVFLVALVIFQLSESVLERNKGIVFFVFFLHLFQQLNQIKHEVRNSRN